MAALARWPDRAGARHLAPARPAPARGGRRPGPAPHHLPQLCLGAGCHRLRRRRHPGHPPGPRELPGCGRGQSPRGGRRSGSASSAPAQISNRPLDCSSKQALAESYRKSFFLSVALAELVALVAFMASFVADAGWHFLLGAAFLAIGFAWLALTTGRLARRQEDLGRTGCELSLRAAAGRLPFRPRSR